MSEGIRKVFEEETGYPAGVYTSVSLGEWNFTPTEQYIDWLESRQSEIDELKENITTYKNALEKWYKSAIHLENVCEDNEQEIDNLKKDKTELVDMMKRLIKLRDNQRLHIFAKSNGGILLFQAEALLARIE